MTTMPPTSLLTETLISLIQAARKLPPGRNGSPVSLGCVIRWVTKGCPAPDGERIRLEAVRLGGRWLTSEQALARFAERLTPRLDDHPAPMPRTPTQRERASQRAAEQLEAAGM
jgi:hypothetical protein